MNLIKKLALSLAIIVPLSTTPALTSCNSENNNVVSEELLNEEIKNINDSISADSSKELECIGFSFQNYNANTVLNVYAQEYFKPIYSYKVTPNSFEQILIQPASYKYYTVTYILDGVDPATLEIPLDTALLLSNTTKGYLSIVNQIVKDGNFESIVEFEQNLDNVNSFN